MPNNSLHEKIGAFSADIETLKKGHDSILGKLDVIEDKREIQFQSLDVRLDKQRWGIVASTFTAGLAPFVASSPIGKEVVTSLITYIEKLFA